MAYEVQLPGFFAIFATKNNDMAKKRYWICVASGDWQQLYDKRDVIAKKEYHAIGLGKTITTVRGQEPTVYADEVWHEISEEDYRKVKKEKGYIIKYDGIHCVGTCEMCKYYMGIKYMPALGNPKKRTGLWGCSCPAEERPYFKENMFGGPQSDKSCCVLKDDEV